MYYAEIDRIHKWLQIQYHLIPVSMQFPRIGKHAVSELKCNFASGLVMTCSFSFDPSGAGV